MRHAASGTSASGGDRERPLTPDGRCAAERLGRRLKSDSIGPDHVLCSPAQRARETLDALAESLDALPPADFDDALYLADSVALGDHLRSAPAETQCLLLIGHNPGLEELVRALAGTANAAMQAGLPAAGLAIFRVAGEWSDLSPSTVRLAAFIAP